MGQQVMLSDPGTTTSADGVAARVGATTHGPADPRRDRGFPWRLRIHGVGLLVGLVGLVLTVALVVVTSVVGDRAEQRLLVTQVHQAAAALELDAQVIQHPLAAASDLAVTDPAAFDAYVAPSVGPGRKFRSVSLWRRVGGGYTPIAHVGLPPAAGPATPGVQRALGDARRTHALAVVGLLDRQPAVLLFAFVAEPGGGQVAAVGEQVVPIRRFVGSSMGPAFSDLRFAIYLGSRPTPSRLLERTRAALTPGGRSAAEVIPFGDGSVTFVAQAVGWLGGGLSQWLPWGIAIAGGLVSLAAAVLTDRIVRRRREAERLAEEVTRLYGEQRSIAETLQQALLPDAPPNVPGLDLAMRYAPGTSGVDVGGDWYDVVPFGPREVLAVVGDVSGRGVQAARVMASLRHGLRAYAAEATPLPELVAKLSAILDLRRDGHFATLVALAIDVEAHTCRVVNAGHLAPLLLEGERASYLATATDPPVGVHTGPYQETRHVVSAGATLVAFTDGLVERRSEGLEPGLATLLAAGPRHGTSDLEELVSALLAELAPTGGDDTAILALRWLS